MAQEEGTTALAEGVPDALTHQGRLVDDEDRPITGDVELTYTIWDHPTEGSVLWQDVVEVEVDDTGFYSVELGGEANPIDAAVVADGQGWLGVAIDGGDELDPRVSLNAVPYALVAEEALVAGQAEWADEAQMAEEALIAESVEDGSIGTDALADDFEVEPQHVESATGETLGGLACSSGEIARFDGTNWSCDDTVEYAETAEVAESVAAGSIQSGDLHPSFSLIPDQIDGHTLGGLSCAAGQIAQFDGNDWSCEDSLEGTVTDVTADSPLVSTGGEQPNISIPEATSNTSGYLHADDYESFDSRLEGVEAGDGVTVGGSDTEPEVGVVFGDEAGTVVEGDDERLSDAREPLPGSDDYIQSDPAGGQDASIHVTEDATVEGTVDAGTVEVQEGMDMNANPVLNNSNNQYHIANPDYNHLEGGPELFGGWEWNTDDPTAGSCNDNCEISSDRAYRGQHSYYFEADFDHDAHDISDTMSGVGYHGLEKEFDEPMSGIVTGSFYGWETSSNHGYHMQFKNEDGERIAAAGTTNPQWLAFNNDGVVFEHESSGDTGDYEEWQHIEITLDMNNDEFFVTYDNPSSNEFSTYGPFDFGTSADAVEYVSIGACHEAYIDLVEVYQGPPAGWRR